MLVCFCTLLAFAHQDAFAAELTAGELPSFHKGAEATTITTQAKKSVYVISSVTIKNSQNKSSQTIKYSYNKDGLLTKCADSNKVLEKYTYKKTKLMSVWHDGGQGAPSNVEFTYKNGKPVKSYDTVNRLTKRFAYNKKGLVSKLVSVYSSSYSVATTFRYNKQGKPVSSQYSTWNNPSYKIDYDAKGNPKLVTEYRNNSQSQYSLTKHKNTYKSGRLTKTVANHVSPKYITTSTVKYKKVSVPASYAAVAKKQQKDQLLLIYAPSTFLYGLPFGYF